MIIVCYLLTLYLVVILGRIVLSWFPVDRESVVATVQDVLVTLTEPVLGPVRRVLPRPGGIPLDLSPIVVIFAIYVLQAILC
jgi:YggT family protein